VQLEQLFTAIIQQYETIAPRDLRIDISKREATIAFIPYAARREKGGEGKLLNTSPHAAIFSPALLSRTGFSYYGSIFGTVLPISLKYATLDAFRYGHHSLLRASDIGAMMQLWVAAASALPYTNDVGQRVVDTLLVMADERKLQPHIPAPAWDWLKKRPVFNSWCSGHEFGTTNDVAQMVRKLGDVELITSYLWIVWSEWSYITGSRFQVMLHLIKEELSGIGAVGYRSDLIQRLDDVLLQLGPGSYRKQQYEELRMVLLEVDVGALTGTSRSRHPFFSY